MGLHFTFNTNAFCSFSTDIYQLRYLQLCARPHINPKDTVVALTKESKAKLLLSAACIHVGRSAEGGANKHTNEGLSVGDKSSEGQFGEIRWVVRMVGDGGNPPLWGWSFL